MMNLNELRTYYKQKKKLRDNTLILEALRSYDSQDDPELAKAIVEMENNVREMSVELDAGADDVLSTLETVVEDDLRRILMKLHYFLGLTWKEAGEMCGLSKNGTETRVYKAIHNTHHDENVMNQRVRVIPESLSAYYDHWRKLKELNLVLDSLRIYASQDVHEATKMIADVEAAVQKKISELDAGADDVLSTLETVVEDDFSRILMKLHYFLGLTWKEAGEMCGLTGMVAVEKVILRIQHPPYKNDRRIKRHLQLQAYLRSYYERGRKLEELTLALDSLRIYASQNVHEATKIIADVEAAVQKKSAELDAEADNVLSTMSLVKSPVSREIMTLHYFHGLSWKEAGALYGITEKQAINRASFIMHRLSIKHHEILNEKCIAEPQVSQRMTDKP